ncbi:hypothetical protein [Sinimarinibacterium flocculans]|uniref:hypothetical protein n=1 Tax=Sinimarinibacterium flocculans TaxID=985250 RepID=UPI00248FDED2|nr:hypothetical protein [Sinimarinibacterium flocculans]
MITVDEVQNALIEYDKAYEKLDKLGKQKTEAQKDMEEKRRIALDLMERNDLTQLQAGRKTFIKGETVYAKVTDEDAFKVWAEDQDEELFRMTPHKKLLNALARTALDDSQPLPPGLEARVQEKITRR